MMAPSRVHMRSPVNIFTRTRVIVVRRCINIAKKGIEIESEYADMNISIASSQELSIVTFRWNSISSSGAS